MSKTFILKRNTSSEERTTLPSVESRNNFYYPATQENHSNEYSDKKQHKRSSSQRYSSPDTFTVKRKRKTSPSPASKGDLKRKMVFVLHDEIKKSPCTTTLEEISDLDRITEMCMSTLRSMMENKKYRKHLHHMNNNNSLPWYNYILCIGSVGSFDDSIIE